MPQTLDQLIEENDITKTPDGQLHIGSIDKVVPFPTTGDPASILSGTIRAVQRIKSQPPIKAPARTASDMASSDLTQTLGQGRDLALGAVKGLGVDPASPVVGTAKNFMDMLKSVIVDPLTGKGTAGAQAGLSSIPEAIVSGPKDAIQGFSEGDFSKMAEGVGNTLSTVGGLVAGGKKAGIPESVAGIKSESMSANLAERAAENRARALGPSTLEDRAVTRKIAPELSEQGMPGLKQKTIDRGVVEKFEQSERDLKATEDRLRAEARPEYQLDRDDILSELRSQRKRLHVRGTDASGYPEAVAALDAQIALVEKLPKFIDFDQAVEFRRQLDQGVNFKQTGSAADAMTMKMKRGVADLFRGKLNELDPALKQANHKYSLNRSAADIVDRRKLGNVGKTDAGIPGRGTLVDDVVAGWAGYAMGGPSGMAVAEGANLARQLPGYSNIKGAAQQRLSEILKPARRQPAGLLTEGIRQMPAPDTSGGQGAIPSNPLGAPATREIRKGLLLTDGKVNPDGSPMFQLPSYSGGDLRGATFDPSYDNPALPKPAPDNAPPPLVSPGKPMPKSVKSGGSLKLTNVEMDPHTGKPSRFVYTDVQTGEKITTTTILK